MDDESATRTEIDTVRGSDWLAALVPGTIPAGAKLHDGVWLPSHEKHLSDTMMVPGCKRFERLPDGRPSYQRFKYRAALQFVAAPMAFVDIGAHCALWSMQAEQDFLHVVAFEPHPVHAGIFPFNMRRTAWTLHRCALGDTEGSVCLDSEIGSSGNTHVVDAAAGRSPLGASDVPVRTLDSFQLERIDLLKIDTEGYELPILVGARETLLRTRPIIVVEQKGHDAKHHGRRRHEAVGFLKDLGWRDLMEPLSGDHFMGYRP